MDSGFRRNDGLVPEAVVILQILNVDCWPKIASRRSYMSVSYGVNGPSVSYYGLPSSTLLRHFASYPSGQKIGLLV